MRGNFGEALKEAGFDEIGLQLKTFAVNYFRSGGSIEQWIAIGREAAEGTPREGQLSIATQIGHAICAHPRQPVEGEKATTSLPEGQRTSAISPSSHREAAASPSTPQGHCQSAAQPREPSPAQRKASLEVARLSIMDTFKIDGLPIGNWTVALARAEGRRKTRDGFVLREAVKIVANAPANALLRNVVKVEEMQRIRQKAEEIADAA